MGFLRTISKTPFPYTLDQFDKLNNLGLKLSCSTLKMLKILSAEHLDTESCLITKY